MLYNARHYILCQNIELSKFQRTISDQKSSIRATEVEMEIEIEVEIEVEMEVEEGRGRTEYKVPSS